MGKKTYIDGKTGLIAIDATQDMILTIRPEHLLVAKCGDPGQCVVAQAIADHFGDDFERVEVTPWTTKVFTKTRIIIFATPYAIGKQVVTFDAEEGWNLPFGKYVFKPKSPTQRIGARPNRRKKVSVKKTGGGQDTFKGRKLPRRRISRIQTLVAN